MVDGKILVVNAATIDLGMRYDDDNDDNVNDDDDNDDDDNNDDDDDDVDNIGSLTIDAAMVE